MTGDGVVWSERQAGNRPNIEQLRSCDERRYLNAKPATDRHGEVVDVVQFVCRIDGTWYDGVWRGCATAETTDCTSVTSEPVPDLHLTDATVELCYCVGHLCNDAARRQHAAVLVTGTVAAAGSFVAVATLAGARLIGGG